MATRPQNIIPLIIATISYGGTPTRPHSPRPVFVKIASINAWIRYSLTVPNPDHATKRRGT